MKKMNHIERELRGRIARKNATIATLKAQLAALKGELAGARDRYYCEGSARTLACLRAGCIDDVEALYLQTIGERGRQPGKIEKWKAPAAIDARVCELGERIGLTRGVRWIIEDAAERSSRS
jgi:hypothetical protein